MSIIKWLGGVTRADLETAVKKAVTAALVDARPPEYDEVLSLAQQAASSARSSAQDADSAAHNATIATQALDAMNESLASHALTLAEIETNHDRTRADLRALTGRIAALEGAPEPQPPPEPPNDDAPPTPPVIVDPTRVPWSLTIDPNAPALPPDLTAYLGHLHAQTDNSGSGGANGIRGYAKQGDLYQLARPVRDCVQALLIALRATGHPRLLETIDTLMEDMRSALRPGWRGVEAVPEGAPGGNGYVEPGQHPDGVWVWQRAGQSIYTGRDNHLLDSVKTFALVASVTLAYHQNGMSHKRDYWLGHLERWEAAWRSNRWQRRRPTTGPIFNRGDGHTHHAELVLYATLHAITGEQRWRDYADVLHRRYWQESSRFRPVATLAGEAFVWFRGRPEDGTAHAFSAPLTYARYYFSDALELHSLSLGEYAHEVNMRRLARTITQLILLPGLPTSAGQMVTSRDVSGGIERASIPASPSGEWSGLTTNLVTGWSCLPLFERWDDTGRLRAWNDAATQAMGYQTSPKGYALPIARLMAATP